PVGEEHRRRDLRVGQVPGAGQPLADVGDRGELRGLRGREGHAIPQRMWPLPVTTYVVEVSSGSPSGPRACSFWVEMPISAPNPNSPPSVNRVDALTRTAAASTAATKRRAAAWDRVTIASEWPLPYRPMCVTASSSDGT